MVIVVVVSSVVSEGLTKFSIKKGNKSVKLPSVLNML